MGDVGGIALGGSGDVAIGASDSAAEATVSDDCMVTTLLYLFFGVLCLLLSPVFRRLGSGD